MTSQWNHNGITMTSERNHNYIFPISFRQTLLASHIPGPFWAVTFQDPLPALTGAATPGASSPSCMREMTIVTVLTRAFIRHVPAGWYTARGWCSRAVGHRDWPSQVFFARFAVGSSGALSSLWGASGCASRQRPQQRSESVNGGHVPGDSTASMSVT